MLYLSSRQNNNLLVAESCRVNDKKMETVKRWRDRGHPKNYCNYACSCSFLQMLAVVSDFLTMQDKFNICTMLVKIKLISTHCKRGKKSSPVHGLDFLPVSKAHTIFRQSMYAYCIYACDSFLYNLSSLYLDYKRRHLSSMKY